MMIAVPRSGSLMINASGMMAMQQDAKDILHIEALFAPTAERGDGQNQKEDRELTGLNLYSGEAVPAFGAQGRVSHDEHAQQSERPIPDRAAWRGCRIGGNQMRETTYIATMPITTKTAWRST